MDRDGFVLLDDCTRTINERSILLDSEGRSYFWQCIRLTRQILRDVDVDLAFCQAKQELGGLQPDPERAGVYLQETGTGLTSYRHIYQQLRAVLLLQRGGLVNDHLAPVATT